MGKYLDELSAYSELTGSKNKGMYSNETWNNNVEDLFIGDKISGIGTNPNKLSKLAYYMNMETTGNPQLDVQNRTAATVLRESLSHDEMPVNGATDGTNIYYSKTYYEANKSGIDAMMKQNGKKLMLLPDDCVRDAKDFRATQKHGNPKSTPSRTAEEILSTPYDQLTPEEKKNYGRYMESMKMGVGSQAYQQLSKQTSGSTSRDNIDFDRIGRTSSSVDKEKFSNVSDKYKEYWGNDGQALEYQYDPKTGNYVFLETQNGSGQKVGLGWTDQQGINKLHASQATDAVNAKIAQYEQNQQNYYYEKQQAQDSLDRAKSNIQYMREHGHGMTQSDLQKMQDSYDKQLAEFNRRYGS